MRETPNGRVSSCRRETTSRPNKKPGANVRRLRRRLREAEAVIDEFESMVAAIYPNGYLPRR